MYEDNYYNKKFFKVVNYIIGSQDFRTEKNVKINSKEKKLLYIQLKSFNIIIYLLILKI